MHLFSVPLDLAVALFFALMLNLDVPGRAIFRTAFYFPAVIPSVAIGILWVMLFNTRGGLVNVAIQAVGLPAIPWLTSPTWALSSLILPQSLGDRPEHRHLPRRSARRAARPLRRGATRWRGSAPSRA